MKETQRKVTKRLSLRESEKVEENETAVYSLREEMEERERERERERD